MVEPGSSATAAGPLPAATTTSLSVEDVRRIVQEVASIISATPTTTTSNSLVSSHTTTGDTISGILFRLSVIGQALGSNN